MDVKILSQLIEMYPDLPKVLGAGVVSMKVARSVLGISKNEMSSLYESMLIAGLVKGVSSAVFRATKDVEAYISELYGVCE